MSVFKRQNDGEKSIKVGNGICFFESCGWACKSHTLMSYEFLLNIDVRFELIKMQMLYIVSGLNISFRIKPSSCLQICQFVLWIRFLYSSESWNKIWLWNIWGCFHDIKHLRLLSRIYGLLNTGLIYSWPNDFSLLPDSHELLLENMFGIMFTLYNDIKQSKQNVMLLGRIVNCLFSGKNQKKKKKQVEENILVGDVACCILFWKNLWFYKQTIQNQIFMRTTRVLKEHIYTID